MKNQKKVPNKVVRELKRRLYNFWQDFSGFIVDKPLSAIGLPLVIVLSLAYLLKYYFG